MKKTRIMTGRVAVNLLLLVLAIAAVPSSTFAVGKNGGTCTGAVGCNGAFNGPQGYEWSGTPCQLVSGDGYTFPCYDEYGNPIQVTCPPGVYLSVVFYPTVICSGGTGDCANVPGFLCAVWSISYDCVNLYPFQTCYKDAACAHTTSGTGD